MRHLSVPSHETQAWLDLCRQHGWLAESGVVVLSDDRRGVPLNDAAPPAEADVWSGHPCVEVEPKTSGPARWQERLPPVLQALPESLWPAAFEIQGDVLIVKVEPEVQPHEEGMANAMLAHMPNVRLVCADEGVEGDFRIRQLRLLATKDGSTTTQTRVKENGATVWVDPSQVYFSARLSTQRQETLTSMQAFRKLVGHPLVVADPYAGVGPAFPLLLNEPDLMAGYLAGDLNPAAVELLERNMTEWTSSLEAYVPSTIVCLDAREWQHQPSLVGQAHALLVNLPHDSFTHLPDLLPILRRDEPSLVRGWAIVERSDLELHEQRLKQAVIEAGGQATNTSVNEVKGFSSTRCFVVFQTSITWE
jgi:tRNA G37 N-methylase Trm5